MSNLRKNYERPVLKAVTGALKQPAIRRGKKRSGIMLADRTNMDTQDENQNTKKKRKLANDKDKENIPPKKLDAVSSETQETAAVLSTKKVVQEEQFQHIFPGDIKRYMKDGYLLPIEYLPNITTAMFANEKKSADLFPDPKYFEEQKDIEHWMRAKLYTWMTEVHLKFKMKEVVLWASFQICDRFLSKVDIPRERLQLVGCTSMWIACKYHEIYPPMAAALIKISDNDFTKSDILTMECRVCDSLSFQFSIPNAFQFLERFTDVAIESIKELRLKNRVKWLARYGMERFNIDVKSLQYCPSMLAAGALCAALILTSHSWTKSCVVVSGYTASQLLQECGDQSIFHQIKKTIMKFDSTSHKAIIYKYKGDDRGGVSMLRKKEKDAPSARPSS